MFEVCRKICAFAGWSVIAVVLIIVCFVHCYLVLLALPPELQDGQEQSKRTEPHYDMALPEILLCNREPLNFTAVTQREPFWNYDQKSDVSVYVKELNDPLGTQELWNSNFLTNTIYNFNSFFTLRDGSQVWNRTYLDPLLYKCENSVSFCQLEANRKLDTPSECCAKMEMFAAPWGLCWLIKHQATTRSSAGGQDQTVSVDIRFPMNVAPGFDVYLIENGEVSQPSYSMEHGTKLELKLVKSIVIDKRFEDIDFEVNWKKTTRAKDESTMKCLALRVRSKCGCRLIHDMFVDWPADKVNDNMTLCNLTRIDDCAREILNQWQLASHNHKHRPLGWIVGARPSHKREFCLPPIKQTTKKLELWNLDQHAYEQMTESFKVTPTTSRLDPSTAFGTQSSYEAQLDVSYATPFVTTTTMAPNPWTLILEISVVLWTLCVWLAVWRFLRRLVAHLTGCITDDSDDKKGWKLGRLIGPSVVRERDMQVQTDD